VSVVAGVVAFVFVLRLGERHFHIPSPWLVVLAGPPAEMDISDYDKNLPWRIALNAEWRNPTPRDPALPGSPIGVLMSQRLNLSSQRLPQEDRTR
jgi:hypothetical protein